MNILILGSGGREHALAWAIRQNPKCDRLIVAPGNAGIAGVARLADLNILDGEEVVEFAEENAIDLIVVGPEAPLGVFFRDWAAAFEEARAAHPDADDRTRFTSSAPVGQYVTQAPQDSQRALSRSVFAPAMM